MNILNKDIILSADTILCNDELKTVKYHSIIIKDGIITDVVPSQQLFSSIQDNSDRNSYHHRFLNNAQHIDLKDKTLLPGLIDTHSHLSLDARLKNHLFMMNEKECVQTIRAIQNIEDDLMAGITTLRSLGDRYYLDIFIRDMVEQDILKGPSMKVCGIGMKSLHGHGYVGQSYTGPDEFRKASRENIFHGSDWLKIFTTPGIPPEPNKKIPCFLIDDEIKAVVDEAHSTDKMVSAHCIGGLALQRCIANGVDMIEHAYCTNKDEVALMMEHDIKLCLTPGVFLDESRESFCHQDLVSKIKKHRQNVSHTMKMIIESGIPFSLGSDAYHGLLYREVLIARDLGADIRHALKGITSTAAKHLGILHECGAITKGLTANIIATDINPIESPETLANIPFVMKHGIIYKIDGVQHIP